MKRSKESNRTCPNPNCCLKGRLGKGNIIRHSFYITRQGRRRRYRCKECGRTFSSTRGTPYYRLHKPRSLFDEVVRMCVHGIAISAMARIKRMAWGTIARWLESAATYAVRFNDRMLRGFVIHELQADEIRTRATQCLHVIDGGMKVGDIDREGTRRREPHPPTGTQSSGSMLRFAAHPVRAYSTAAPYTQHLLVFPVP